MGIVIIFTIVLIIGILLLILYRKFFPYEDNLLVGSLGCITLGGILFIALSISILIIQSNNKPLAAQYEQEYNDIIMALSPNGEKGLSEAGKNILVDRAIDYKPMMDRYLQQDVYEVSSFADSKEALLSMFYSQEEIEEDLVNSGDVKKADDRVNISDNVEYANNDVIL